MAKNAIITGGSSGIGAALAAELSRRGWSLALLARRGDLLEQVCQALPTKSVAIGCDVTDAASLERAVRSGESQLGGPFDLAIANAGVGSFSRRSFDLPSAENTIHVNVLGLMYLFAAVIPSMVERRSGHFAGIASLAGLRGLPTAAAYSASKAAVQTFLEASRVDLAAQGIKVTIVNPGYIATAMTEKNKFKMPFLMPVEKAARIIADGIERGARVVEFPWPMSKLMRFARLLPDAVWDRMVKR
ncbi:MAG TPA: SDR family NAD(P)-dependent oxidoreductase [Thermoanaerobaculia bacterium]|nr:SDR family NAD(P)-dependent oxidoreductase [Thermoanaerobaculia bacterium]